VTLTCGYPTLASQITHTDIVELCRQPAKSSRPLDGVSACSPDIFPYPDSRCFSASQGQRRNSHRPSSYAHAEASYAVSLQNLLPYHHHYSCRPTVFLPKSRNTVFLPTTALFLFHGNPRRNSAGIPYSDEAYSALFRSVENPCKA
jgi:hypothetical protein